MTDHTLLKPEATAAQVRVLLDEAIELATYAVCVSPSHLPPEPSGRVKVATVCGFPSGAHHSRIKSAEAADSAARGADEVDMVINLAHALTNDFHSVEADIRAVREGCLAPTVLKVIIESAALSDEQIVS